MNIVISLEVSVSWMNQWRNGGEDGNIKGKRHPLSTKLDNWRLVSKTANVIN